MPLPHYSAVDYVHNVHLAVRDLGINPNLYDLEALATDIHNASSDHTYPIRQNLRKVRRFVNLALPAYLKDKPSGPYLPDADNLRPHVPDARYGDIVADEREPFDFDAWATACHTLYGWIGQNIRRVDPDTFNLEKALVGLLMAFPEVEVGKGTVKSLAGRLGMAEMAYVLTTYYGSNSGWGDHWDPEEDDLSHLDNDDDQDQDDDAEPLDLTGWAPRGKWGN